MASVNPLLARWQAGQPTLGGWLTTADPGRRVPGHLRVRRDLRRPAARAGRRHDSAAVFRAIELHGVAPTTRVPANDSAAIGKALDVGAPAIVVPMVGTPRRRPRPRPRATTRRAATVGRVRCAAVRPSLAPARGARRGCLRRDGRDGRRRPQRRRHRGDARVSTPSTSGPATWPSALGCPPGRPTGRPEEAKLHAEAIERIREACLRHGVAPGMHTGDGAVARGYLEQGFLMVTVISELALITGGGKDHLATARSAVASSKAPAPV